jgi:glycosyltransferase involved in cell wall biosynthesis
MLLPFWKADVITVVSETTEKEIGFRFPFFKNKIRVIPNPVKLCFRFSERIVSDKFRILQIGRAKHKNLKNLIAAIKEMDGIHLDIIADLDEETLSCVREKRISFTQFQNLSDDEVYQRYIACDILFFASLYEGFGMPIIEAQTVGRPVITSNFGAMLEIAKDSAVLVSPDSVDEIRKAIVELKENVSFYNEVVARGLSNAANYSAERVSEEYLNLYKSINKI